MKEIWKDIKGYEGLYQVSNLGRVKSLSRYKFFGKVRFKTKEKILKPHNHITGYLRVTLKKKHHYIHRIMAKAFIENEKKYPCINHIDGNKHNNSINNLEWVSYSKNNQHAFDIGLKKPTIGEKQGSSKLTEEQVSEIRKKYKKGINQYAVGNSKKLASDYGVSQSTIVSVVEKQTWKHI